MSQAFTTAKYTEEAFQEAIAHLKTEIPTATQTVVPSIETHVVD